MQDQYRCVYCVVDMHAITVRQDPVKLRQHTLEAYALLLACGIDLEKSILFIQSHVRTHAELNWLLCCNTQFGELSRMTQFKDKSARHADDVNAGLFTYPSLMAADILAYNAEPYIPDVGARVMSLQDPTKKMSKSDDNPNACILILDDKDAIIRKFKRAVTDSDSEVCYREGKDGINNLMSIYASVTGKSYDQITAEFAGHGYGDFKVAVGEAVADHLQPIRDNFARIIADKAYLKECYTASAEKALRYSQRIVSKAYHKVGFVDKG